MRYTKRTMTFADDAILFAKQHRNEISRRLTDPARFPPSESPVTVFMAGSPILLSEMYDRTLKNKQTAVVDGTFANYEKASENIRRSLKRNRAVTVFYLYQVPEVAWRFTLAREKVEGRNIPKDAFVDQFIRVRQTIEKIHRDFGDTITIVLVIKDYSTNAVSSQHVLRAHDGGLDAYLAKEYTREELSTLI